MAFRVSLAPQALRELDEITNYISRRGSLAIAERWFNKIFAEIYSLSQMPSRCPISDTSADAGMEIRMLLHGQRNRQYKVYFTIKVKQRLVHVLHVRHWARTPLNGKEWAKALQEYPND
ncbi:MAG: type II toxin-antitoxin system RelE/ParE family toxin [Acidobacteriota bacterium]